MNQNHPMNTETASITSSIQGELKSLAGRSFPLHKALAELIDNCVDAEATTITITMEDGGSLAIIDNGKGFADITSAIRLNQSDKTDAIGRYGIGMKNTVLAYSDTTEIISRGRRLVIPWKRIMDGVMSPDSLVVESVDDEGATVVRLIGFDRKRIDRNEGFSFTELRRTYHPRLFTGELAIVYNGKKLPVLDMPPFIETLDLMIEHLGKKARIYGGIYPPNAENKTNWKGYNPYYKGRLIGNGKIQNAGVGETDCTNFCFLLDLIDDDQAWGLSTNKDEVSKLTAFLDEVVFEHTRAMLMRGAEASSDIALKESVAALNRILGGGGNII